ncbi:hypothetical protein QQ045_004566 [Rhodiola kirilowii]
MKTKSKRMKASRDAKMNHHSGKTLFPMRAIDHMEKGHKAPHIATYAEVYIQEPESGKLVDQMNAEVKQLIEEQYFNDPSVIQDPLSTSTQLDIICRVVGQKKELWFPERVGI